MPRSSSLFKIVFVFKRFPEVVINIFVMTKYSVHRHSIVKSILNDTCLSLRNFSIQYNILKICMRFNIFTTHLYLY